MATPSPIRDAIVAADQQWMSAFSRGDAAAVAQMYTEEGQLLPPGNDPIRDRRGIQAFWQGVMGMGVKAIKLETVEVMHHGDTVCEVGRFVLEGAGGQPLDHGKYVDIWQRHGESWKIYLDIWNTSQSAQAPSG